MKTVFEILNMEIVLLFCLLSCAKFAFGVNECPRPPFPLGGGKFSPYREFYKVKDVVSYICDANSKHIYMFGNSTRVCLENGMWSGSLPYCVQPSIAQLVGPDSHQKALVDGNENTCLDVNMNHSYIGVNFEHSGNYKRLSLQIVSNQKNENLGVILMIDTPQETTYTSVELTEIRKFTDGQLFYHIYTFENSALFTEPYFLIVNNYNENCCKICDIVLFADRHSSCPWIPNSKEVSFITYDNIPRNTTSYFEYGSAAIFDCIQGFSLKGDKIRYCAEDNKWTGSNPSCEAIQCLQEPPAVRNGFWPEWRNGEIYFVNHTLEAVCKSGFINDGQLITSACSYEGNWSQQSIQGRCQEISTNRYSMVLFCAGVGLGIVLILAVVIVVLKCKKRERQKEEMKNNLI